MRRQDRELSDPQELRQLIDSQIVCRLALNDEGAPYIVPLNYGVLWQDGQPLFYFHSAREGHKLDLLEFDNRAALEIDAYDEVRREGGFCQYAMPYRSAVARGHIEFVGDAEEKALALKIIIGHSCRDSALPPPDFRFDDADLDSVCVYKLIVEQLSAKGCR